MCASKEILWIFWLIVDIFICCVYIHITIHEYYMTVYCVQ